MEIYCIENLKDHKKYVGTTHRTTEQRFRRHCSNALAGIDFHLYRAMRKYGINSFVAYKIDEAESKEILSDKERFWIKELDTLKNGYNMTIGGDGGPGAPIGNQYGKGWKAPPDWCKANSERGKRRDNSHLIPFLKGNKFGLGNPSGLSGAPKANKNGHGNLGRKDTPESIENKKIAGRASWAKRKLKLLESTIT